MFEWLYTTPGIPLCDIDCGDTPRLSTDDAALLFVKVCLLQKILGHLSGLAAAGVSRDDHHSVLSYALDYLVLVLRNGQLKMIVSAFCQSILHLQTWFVPEWSCRFSSALATLKTGPWPPPSVSAFVAPSQTLLRREPKVPLQSHHPSESYSSS